MADRRERKRRLGTGERRMTKGWGKLMGGRERGGFGEEGKGGHEERWERKREEGKLKFGEVKAKRLERKWETVKGENFGED